MPRHRLYACREGLLPDTGCQQGGLPRRDEESVPQSMYVRAQPPQLSSPLSCLRFAGHCSVLTHQYGVLHMPAARDQVPPRQGSRLRRRQVSASLRQCLSQSASPALAALPGPRDLRVFDACVCDLLSCRAAAAEKFKEIAEVGTLW